MMQLMRWHKERIRDSKDPDIMSHLADAEAWHALDRFDSEFSREPRSVHLGLRWMVSNIKTLIVQRTLAGLKTLIV
jgi:hypothetical protein